MQLNAVIMADAGAKRIYEIIDTESEVDDGVVTLEQIDHDHWAWHHPRKMDKMNWFHFVEMFVLKM